MTLGKLLQLFAASGYELQLETAIDSRSMEKPLTYTVEIILGCYWHNHNVNIEHTNSLIPVIGFSDWLASTLETMMRQLELAIQQTAKDE